jgi:peptidoglycan hydrolase-like protein with peptidoglycan-binding domain
MTPSDLQVALQGLGFYQGKIDGRFGPLSRTAFLHAMRGDPARLTADDLQEGAELLGVSAAHVGAVVDVESAGRGFHPETARPIILYEPHIFSRLTGHRHSPCAYSYRSWGDQAYPKTQAARYEQMMDACAVDPGSALRSASWGLGQIMGFNHPMAGFDDIWAFVRAMVESERQQLLAMLRFVRARGLADDLRRGDWGGFALGYNGSGFARHAYDQKLKAAYARRLAA